MPRITDNKYKEIAKKLKLNKLISYDLRKSLNPQQKAAITRQWNQYGDFIEGDYVKRSVSKKRAIKMKQTGFKTHNKNVWLPTEGFDKHKIRIKGDKVIYSSADKYRIIPIQLKSEFLAKLKKLSKKKLKRGEFVTVKIGVNAPFWKLFTSYGELLNYVTGWEPKEDKNIKDELIGQMSTVVYFDGK